MRRGCLVLIIGFILIVATPFLWRGGVKVYFHRAMYAPPTAPQRPVAVVFGAAVYGNGRLSPVLRDRVETAIALYESGQVDQILVSGDNSSYYYDEPGAMMAYAIERGVDAADILADRAGHRTYDTCYRASKVFDVESAVLVTQAFHLPRALLTCQSLGIDAIGATADRRAYRDAGWYEIRETAATLVAAWDVLRREPPPIVEATDSNSQAEASRLVGSD
jgi:SanA protein